MASLVGSVLLLRLSRQMKTRDARMSLRDESSKMYKNGVCQSKKAIDTEVLIVGAGVTGSAIAYALGKDGRRVHVIERSLTKPDRIVGEVLQPGAYLKLKELDLEDCVEGIDAQRVSGYTIYKDGKKAELSYPIECFPLNVTGRSLHNGRFIQKMREKAASLPNVTLEQGTATSLLEVQRIIKGVHYKTKAGQESIASAPLTIVSDGCFSKLQRFLCDTQVDTPSYYVGLALENCKLPFPDHAHLIFGNRSLVMLYRISSSEIRCLIDIPGQNLPSISNGEMAQYLKNVVASQPVASTVNMLSEFSYKLLGASPDLVKNEMHQLLFDFASVGGVVLKGPIAVFSGVDTHSSTVLVSLFAITTYGIGRFVGPFPSPARIRSSAILISVLSEIIVPILKAEGYLSNILPFLLETL